MGNNNATIPLPCPFCGGNVNVIETWPGYSCVCSQCDTKSAIYPTQSEAVQHWNNYHKRFVDKFVSMLEPSCYKCNSDINGCYCFRQKLKKRIKSIKEK